jgi:hypothetical protein
MPHMKKSFFYWPVLFLLLSIPYRSLAWGQTGHRVVGQIADSYLNAKARAAIKKILGPESLAMASNWADFIKSDSNYKYLDAWHYVNYEKNLDYDRFRDVLKKDTAVDAYTKLNFLVRELKNKSLPQDKKLMYLRLLIHIVGDVHQPLHVSPVGTTGGNDIKLQWFNNPSNLHRVWDSDMLDQQQLSYTEYAAAVNHPTAIQKKNWEAQPRSQWFFESYTIAQNLHNEITETNPRLSYRYIFDHIATANEQLLKGGIHLAALLNEIFGK